MIMNAFAKGSFTSGVSLATPMGIMEAHFPAVFLYFMYGNNECQIANKTKTKAELGFLFT